jgi:hypothetical protein
MSGLMEVFSKGGTSTIKLTEKAELFTQTAMFTKENGKTIKPMASEFTPTLTDQNMRDIGNMTSKMEMESKPGLMAQNSKVTMSMA